MSTDEYVPSEFMVRGAYNYFGGSGTESDATLDAEFDRFLAQVRRDAAREGYRAGYNDRQAERDYDHAYPEEKR